MMKLIKSLGLMVCFFYIYVYIYIHTYNISLCLCTSVCSIVDEDYIDDESEEISVEELIRLEGIDSETYVDDDEDVDDDDEEDDDEDDDEDEEDEEVTNKNMGSFWSSSPTGKIDEKYSNIPGLPHSLLDLVH